MNGMNRCSRRRLRAVLALILLVAACADSNDQTSIETETASIQGPTFYDDVAPIFVEKCAQCHQEGGIAPFSLVDYEAARVRASMIADFTQNRVMPPFLIEPGGSCGSFDESAALSEEQIAVIGAWARSGAREGAPRGLTVPALPTLDDGKDFPIPSFTPRIAAGQVARFDEYRCFTSPVAPDRDGYITGYQVIPGRPSLVHHVFAIIVDPNKVTQSGLTNARAMDRLHAADPDREGWTCYGLAGDGVEPESAPVIWAPGEGVVNLPEGLGLRIQRDWRVVIQVHYNMASVPPEADDTTVRLKIVDSVERQGVIRFQDKLLASSLGPQPVQIEPGKKSALYTYESSGAELGLPPQVPTELVWLWPHMHNRGHKLTFEVDNGAGYSCAGRVNSWDFNWQRIYEYAPRVPFDSNSRVRVTCDYDTSHDTQPVLPGWGTQNEMCFVMLLLAMPPGFSGPISVAPGEFVQESMRTGG